MTDPARLTVDGKSYTLANQVSAHKLRELLDELGAVQMTPDDHTGLRFTVTTCPPDCDVVHSKDDATGVHSLEVRRIESARRAELWPSIATAAALDGVGGAAAHGED